MKTMTDRLLSAFRSRMALRRFEQLLNSLLRMLTISLPGLALGLLVIAPICFWTDSEIWAMSSSAELFHKSSAFAFAMKPAFYLLLYLLTNIAHFFEVNFMTFGRYVFALNAWLMMFLTYRITTVLTRNRVVGLFAVGLLLTSVEFVEQAYRVRSDFAATSTILILLVYLLHTAGMRNESGELETADLSFKSGLNLAALGVLAIAFTPNAAVPLLAISPAIYAIRRAPRGQLSFSRVVRLNRKITVAVAAAAAVFAAAIWVKGFESSLGFFFESFSTKSVGFAYWSLIRFQHLLGFAIKDKLFVSLLLMSVVSAIWVPKSRSKLENSFVTGSAFLFILLILHPNKLPFMIASFLPFFAIAAAVTLKGFIVDSRILKRRDLRVGAKLVALIALSLQVIVALKAERFIKANHNSSDQAAVISYLNLYLHQFNDPTYYDVIGILPDYPPTNYFIGPGQQAANQLAESFLQRSQFDFIFYVHKLQEIAQPIAFFLYKNYIDAGHGIFVRALEFYPPELHLDPNLTMSDSALVKIVRESFHLSQTDRALICLQAMDESGRDITVQLRRKTSVDTAVQVNETPYLLQPKSERIYFPKDFASLRVSPFGCPKIPTENTMLNLFRFDPDL